jgi:hypothetical protein
MAKAFVFTSVLLPWRVSSNFRNYRKATATAMPGETWWFCRKNLAKPARRQDDTSFKEDSPYRALFAKIGMRPFADGR